MAAWFGTWPVEASCGSRGSSGLPPACREYAANLAKWFPEVLLTLGAPDLDDRCGIAAPRVLHTAEGTHIEVVLPPSRGARERGAMGRGTIPTVGASDAAVSSAAHVQSHRPWETANGIPQGRVALLDALEDHARDIEAYAAALAGLSRSAELQQRAPSSSVPARTDVVTGDVAVAATSSRDAPVTTQSVRRSASNASTAGAASCQSAVSQQLRAAPAAEKPAAAVPPKVAAVPVLPHAESAPPVSRTSSFALEVSQPGTGPDGGGGNAFTKTASERGGLRGGGTSSNTSHGSVGAVQAVGAGRGGPPSRRPGGSAVSAAAANAAAAAAAAAVARRNNPARLAADGMKVCRIASCPTSMSQAASSSTSEPPKQAAASSSTTEAPTPAATAAENSSQAAVANSEKIVTEAVTTHTPGKDAKMRRGQARQVRQGDAESATPLGRCRTWPGKLATWRNERQDLSISITKVQKLTQEPMSPKLAKPPLVWGKASRPKSPEAYQDRSAAAIEARIEKNIVGICGESESASGSTVGRQMATMTKKLATV